MRSLKTSVTDLNIAAATTVINLRQAVEQLTRVVTEFEQTASSPSPSSSSSAAAAAADNSLLQQTVAMLNKLSNSLNSAKTDVLKRQKRVETMTTLSITSDGSDTRCQSRRWYSLLFNFMTLSNFSVNIFLREWPTGMNCAYK